MKMEKTSKWGRWNPPTKTISGEECVCFDKEWLPLEAFKEHDYNGVYSYTTIESGLRYVMEHGEGEIRIARCK
jgi:hypothetical protein